MAGEPDGWPAILFSSSTKQHESAKNRPVRVSGYILAFAVLLGLGIQDAESKPTARGLLVGSDAPQFTLKTINPQLSKQRTLSSRKWFGPKRNPASKGLALTFGASYCEPCKKELAVLAKKSAEIRKAGYFLTAIVIDRDKKGMEEMRKLAVEKLKIDFPVLSDSFGILARRYKADTLPMMVVVDPDGKISWIHSGYKESALSQFLEKMGTKT